MKNKIQFLQFVAILLISFSTYSQVSVSMQNLQYTNNGQSTISAANCGNIDLASSTSTSINLGINLSKPNSQVVGLSDLRVYTQKSSSDSRVEKSWVQIQETFWNQPSSGNGTYSTTASFSINSADFNASGGTLFVVFKSSGGTEYRSTCNFTITKTLLPSFSFSPTNLSLSCGDTSARTFTVSPANIPSGSTVTYQWSYSGWSLVASSTNSITLTPNSVTSLVSNVTVYPFINGVSQPTKTCTVNIVPFTTSAIITGIDLFCNTQTASTFTIGNPDPNSTISWSSSNPSIASVSGASNSQVTLTALSVGSCNLNAEITNSCGQKTTITKLIGVGKPHFDIAIQQTGGGRMDLILQGLSYTNGGGIELSDINAQNITNVVWEIVSTNPTNCGRLFPLGKTARLLYSSSTCRTQVKATAISSCGTTSVNRTFVGSGGGLQRLASKNKKEIIDEQEQNTFMVYPNPSKDIVNVVLNNSYSTLSQTYKGQLVNINGTVVKNIEISNIDTTFSVQGVPKGVYILKIILDGQTESHRIIVE